jgi:hypothetical protein
MVFQSQCLGSDHGTCQEANHAFLRRPEGKFTTFEVPDAGKRSRVTSGFYIAGTTASAENGTNKTEPRGSDHRLVCGRERCASWACDP